MSINAIKDSVAAKIFGLTATEAVARGICVACGESVASRIHSDAGWREYRTSGSM